MFAMFSGWYYWIPKILGLNYNITLSKAQFWILFIGVNLTGRLFVVYLKRLWSSIGKGGSPLNPNKFIPFFFENIKDNKKHIYIEFRKGVYVFINKITNEYYIGSSINLTKRMVSYYYYNSDKPSWLLERWKNMA